jgi:hypothetical protein
VHIGSAARGIAASLHSSFGLQLTDRQIADTAEYLKSL